MFKIISAKTYRQIFAMQLEDSSVSRVLRKTNIACIASAQKSFRKDVCSLLGIDNRLSISVIVKIAVREGIITKKETEGLNNFQQLCVIYEKFYP